MKIFLIPIFAFTVVTGIGQTLTPIKVDSNLYSHAVDSLVKYILAKERPASIILYSDLHIRSTIPKNIQGQKIIKTKNQNKLKVKDNSICIIVYPLGGTKNDRSVFLAITKYVNGYWGTWEGYGYDFKYSFDALKDFYVLKEVTKNMLIR